MTRGRPRKDTTLGVGETVREEEIKARIADDEAWSQKMAAAERGEKIQNERLYTLAAQIFAAKVSGAYAGVTDTAQAAIREARVFLDVFDAEGK